MTLSTYQAALLERLEAELASRNPSASNRPPFNPLPLCHAGQAEAVADRTPTAAWITTRRAGKTTGAVFLMLETADATPNVNVLYLSTTIKRAVSTVWDELLRANKDHGLGGIPNHTRHFLRLPNGSKVWVSGMETRTEADAWRGVLPRTALVFLDEGQDHKPELLSYVYASVILPSLADIGGRFVLAGTPGAPRGFFYDFHRAPGVRFYRWSLFDNPHVLDARKMLAEAMRVRGCDETDPSILREFYGEFATDSQRQIFPVGEHNWFDARPMGRWTYCIGADFGTVDHAAYVVLGWLPHDPTIYVLESDSQPNMGSSAQVELVRAVAARYEGAYLVGDPGGGGASHMVQLRQEHWVPIEAAKKPDKAAACITMRDGLRSGRVKLARTETALGSELGEPEWDPDRVGEVIRGHFPDRVDAMLYAYRKAVALHHATAAPTESTREQREMDAVLEAQARERSMLEELGLQ